MGFRRYTAIDNHRRGLPPGRRIARWPIKKNIHVVKDGDAWKVEVEGNKRASAVTGTQQESIARARHLGRNNPGGAEVSIHGVNGKVRAKDTIKPANDPKDIPGLGTPARGNVDAAACRSRNRSRRSDQ
ncbi:DUF2188 domain-containing protein [Mycobacterium sp. GA-2829]|uniref:DUF2188 domain-containing protein n=1 Tax=Mycobacterium sp. GA-2829 TaxID=1772283 RepID=UPI0009E86D76